MATTTVAAGKVKVYKLNHKPLPSGWVVDGDGKGDHRRDGGLRLRLRQAGRRHHAARRHARRGQPQGLWPGRDGAHPRRLSVGGVVLAAAQPDAEAVGPAQHRPLLPGHRPARVPRRGRVRGGSRPGHRRAARPSAPIRTSPCSSPEIRRWPRARDRLEHGVPVPDDLMPQLRAVAKSAGVPFVLAP